MKSPKPLKLSREQAELIAQAVLNHKNACQCLFDKSLEASIASAKYHRWQTMAYECLISAGISSEQALFIVGPGVNL